MKNEDKDLLKDTLQKIANEQNVLVMSFIAPATLVRRSPIAYDSTQIRIQDLYKIEEIIEGLKEKGELPEKLHLVIHTPGGRVDASTKIARYLQKSFKEIEAYVPYEAASGGTVLCLAAKIIVMSETSSLTPIDPQIVYKGTRVSALSYEQVLNDMERKYGTMSPEEIPSPYQQLCHQLDPITFKEMQKIVTDSLAVAYDLLVISQKPTTSKRFDDLFDTVMSLGKTNHPHSHLIDIDEAREIGLNISNDTDKLNLLKTYKKWVSSKLNEKETRHIINCFNPKKGSENNEQISDKARKNQAS